MNNIVWLEEWYKYNCDGWWEHSYGIEIETLDNPGWHVKIDISETDYADLKPKELSQYIANNNWIKCSINNGVFNGFGDCMKLAMIIQTFKKWIEVDKG